MNKQEKIEYTKDKLNEGWSQRKIARELNVDSSTVGYWIKQNFKISSHVSSAEHYKLCECSLSSRTYDFQS